jgi:DNA invertase Pin-like site-specific DNA recombinase
MIKCAIYPRKSKQMDNSDSMETQIDMCIRYLREKYGEGNYSVSIYDGDYGITGHSTKQRKDFQRMMNDIANGEIQLVLIQRYDRIARNTRDFCNLYHDMETNGCNLVSVSQQIDTTTPYGKNFMYMQASMAELEWALSSERRKDTNKYARSVGKCTLARHSIPYGYKAEIINGVRKMVKDKEKEEIVMELFDYYDRYRNSSATARYLNEKYGTTFEHRRIRRIVKSTYYYGKYDMNDNFCEPYITKEFWDSIQEYRPVIRCDESKRTEILFNGMIRCPECNRLMRSCQKKHKSGNRTRYFHCEYHSQGLCGFRKVKSEILLEEMLINKIDEYMRDFDLSVKEREEKKKTVEDNSKKYQQELERLNTMFLKGRIDENYYDTEYLRLNSLIAQNKENTKSQGHSERLREAFVENWKEVYSDLDKLNKKLFWRGVIKQIIVDENMNVIDVIFL